MADKLGCTRQTIRTAALPFFLFGWSQEVGKLFDSLEAELVREIDLKGLKIDSLE